MKPVFLLMVALALLATALPANNLSVLDNSDECLRLHFDLNNYQMNTADAAAPVRMQEEQDNLVLNNYNLPVFTYMIQVPDGHKAVVRIASPRYATEENISLAKTDSDIISTDDYVILSEPFVMRGNLLSTLAVQPFIYKSDSGSLQILISADIEIQFIADRAFTLTRTVRQTKEYKSWLAQSVLNYRDNSRDVVANGSLLIIYNASASALSIIQPLIDWKHQKGWEVHTASTAVAGSSTSAIKNYIQDAYDTWDNPPEYILILGRSTSSNTVPTYVEYYNHQAVGDYKYTLLDGTDIIPDAYIGRLTFSSSDQLTTMINKIIAYEKQVGLDNSEWYNKALLMSDPTQSGVSCNTTIEYIRDLMLNYNPSTTYTYTNSGSFVSVMTSSIAQGVGVFHYRGHNGYSGLTGTDITGINNNGKYPFISFITCFSGNFGSQSTTCPGENFIRSGTSTLPRGAIGFVGASCETHTCLNNIMMGGLAYGLYNEGLTSQGQATVRAKLALKACYPQDPANYLEQNFQSVNLLGDPSVDIWLKQPLNIYVDHFNTVQITNGVMQVTITDANGDPVQAAKVCLLKGDDEIFQIGYTNENGVYTFEWAAATAGTGKLTVTKPNYCTYQGNVTFVQSTTSFTIANMTAFNSLAAGTTYSLPLSLTNNYSALNNVWANLSSQTEYIGVTNPTVHFGNMSINQTTSSQENVTFTISPDCPQGANLDFTLIVMGHDGANIFSTTLFFNAVEAGPNLTVFSTLMGADNVLTPGETSNFTINLKNLGTSAATAVSAHLYSYNPDLTITPASVNYNNIAVNQLMSNSTPFSVHAASTMYVGTPVKIELQMLYNNGTTQDLSITIIIGNVTSTAMTGPDSYGYICVANSDNHPLAKPYAWVELNPAMGGSGTQLTMTDNNTEGSGSWQTVSLIDPFRFYGVSYNQLTICSNGFIMPGANGSQEWMNWQIPGPMVPRPILAPFWDDLIIQTTSKILYQYDSVNQRFIVEWYGLKNRYFTSYQETFEVIIYFADEYQTPTGDHSFLFQYNAFNNVDAGNYGVDYVDHGQYATVGIADHTGNVGLGYTYQNVYPVSATNLTNNSTLFFSTMPSYNSIPHPIVQSFTFTETVPVYANNQIDCGETISLTPVIANMGFAGLPLSSLTLTSLGDYVTIQNGTSTLPALEPQADAPVGTPFVISIAPECPNLTVLVFDIAFTTENTTFHTGFNLLVHAPQVAFGSLMIDGVLAAFLPPDILTPGTLRIFNVSNLPVDNAMFTFSGAGEWTVVPGHADVSIPASGYTDVPFSIQADAAEGETITFGGTLTIGATYDSLCAFPMYVGNMVNLAAQDCEIPAVNAAWTLTSGASYAPAQYINAAGTEIVITPAGAITHYYVYSPVIFARDSQLIQVKFNYLSQNSYALNTLYYSINESTTWLSLMSYNIPQDSVAAAECYVRNLPANTQSIRFRWQTTTDGTHNGIIALDDFLIRAIHHAVGIVNGTINLEGNPANITQVSISTSEQPGIIVHPDAEGHYCLPLYQGIYTMNASLDGYLSRLISNVVVWSGVTLNNVNFELPYLQKPVNLTYQINTSILTLNWQLESLPRHSKPDLESTVYTRHSKPDLESNPRRLTRSTPHHYKVVIIRDGFVYTDTTSANTYQRNIVEGNFRVYVQSVYLNDLHQEVLSDSSNLLLFVYTGADDQIEVTQCFALQQNYPNPCSALPKGTAQTRIRYSLKEDGLANLSIYNVKGQCVRTLVNALHKKGSNEISFNGFDEFKQALPSGVYYYRLTSGNQTLTRKMMILK